MALMTWDPLRELDVLRREFERLFSEISGNGGRSWPAAFLPGRSARAYPLVNIREDRDNLYIEALAPGLDPGTLEITVVRDTLRMQGEKQPIADTVKPEAFHRSERSAGRFVRTMTLPSEVDGDRVSAEYKNGILRVTLPKTEKAKPKQIAIDVK